jgi:hypothetical protein
LNSDFGLVVAIQRIDLRALFDAVIFIFQQVISWRAIDGIGVWTGVVVSALDSGN